MKNYEIVYKDDKGLFQYLCEVNTEHEALRICKILNDLAERHNSNISAFYAEV